MLSNKSDIGIAFLVGALLPTILIAVICMTPNKIIEPSEKHKRQCMEYALKDHSGEIGHPRYEWLSQFGDPNDVEFFYQSCLGQVTGRPAEKEYMK